MRARHVRRHLRQRANAPRHARAQRWNVDVEEGPEPLEPEPPRPRRRPEEDQVRRDEAHLRADGLDAVLDGVLQHAFHDPQLVARLQRLDWQGRRRGVRARPAERRPAVTSAGGRRRRLRRRGHRRLRGHLGPRGAAAPRAPDRDDAQRG